MLAAAGRADSVNSGSVVEILKHATVALASSSVPQHWPLRHALTNWWVADRSPVLSAGETRARRRCERRLISATAGTVRSPIHPRVMVIDAQRAGLRPENGNDFADFSGTHVRHGVA